MASLPYKLSLNFQLIEWRVCQNSPWSHNLLLLSKGLNDETTLYLFDKCRRIPNRKLISHTIKELFGWQRKAA